MSIVISQSKVPPSEVLKEKVTENLLAAIEESEVGLQHGMAFQSLLGVNERLRVLGRQLEALGIVDAQRLSALLARY